MSSIYCKLIKAEPGQLIPLKLATNLEILFFYCIVFQNRERGGNPGDKDSSYGNQERGGYDNRGYGGSQDGYGPRGRVICVKSILHASWCADGNGKLKIVVDIAHYNIVAWCIYSHYNFVSTFRFDPFWS